MKSGKGCFGAYWISPARLKRQQLKRTFQLLHPRDGQWTLGYDRLAARRKEVTARATKAGVASVSLTLIVINLLDASDKTFRLLGNEVTVSAAAVGYLASVTFFLAVMHIQTAVQLILFMQVWSRRIMLTGFNEAMYSFLIGLDENAPAFPMGPNLFFERKSAERFFSALMLAMILVLLAPLGWAAVALVDLQVGILDASDEVSVDVIAALLGLLSLASAGIYVVIFNTPLPLRKHSELIRWIFLYNLPVGRPEDVYRRWVGK